MLILFNTTCEPKPKKFVKNFCWAHRSDWVIELRLWKWQILICWGEAANLWVDLYNRKGATKMNLQEILSADAKLNAMEMGPERWQGSIELRMAKTKCPEYKIPDQKITFSEWMKLLADYSKTTGVDWASDEARAGYYEGQPDTWVEYYDGGETPEEAVDNDLENWDG
jgi:hypothetical protein